VETKRMKIPKDEEYTAGFKDLAVKPRDRAGACRDSGRCRAGGGREPHAEATTWPIR